MPTAELSGVTVLVTRPAHQADALCSLIEQAGGEAVRFPTIEICAPTDPAELEQRIDALPDTDIVIFVSPNAADYGIRVIMKYLGVLPSHLRVVAMGAGTAQQLSHMGIAADIVPSGRSESEVLLNHPSLADVRDKTVVIFRGDSGRPLLGDTLKRRGAQVHYANCYRRAKTKKDPKPLQQRGLQGEIDIITLTSVAALGNLLAILGPCDWIKQSPSVVFSHRIATACHKQGFTIQPLVVDEASDRGIVDKLIQWQCSF